MDYVTIVNRSFLSNYKFRFEHIDGKLFRKIGLPNRIEAFIDKLFLTECFAPRTNSNKA